MPDGQDPPSQSRGLCWGRVLWASRSSGEAESRHYGNSSEAGSTSDSQPRSLPTFPVHFLRDTQTAFGKTCFKSSLETCSQLPDHPPSQPVPSRGLPGPGPPTESPRGLEPPVPAWSLLDHGSGSENSLPGPFYWDLPPGSSSSLQASLESEEKSMDPQFRRAAQAAAPAAPLPPRGTCSCL